MIWSSSLEKFFLVILFFHRLEATNLILRHLMMIPASADKFFIDNRGISWTRKPQDLRSLSANFAHDRNFGSQVLLSSLLDAANKNRIPNLQLAVCLSKEYGTSGYLTHQFQLLCISFLIQFSKFQKSKMNSY